jgi:sigma-B regulation protein RsbU (phosphoserine phosphatase)
VVLYTDGITEAFDAERRMFGETRLDEVIAATDGSPARVVEAVVTAVADHEGGRPRADDQCVVVARYEGAAATV